MRIQRTGSRIAGTAVLLLWLLWTMSASAVDPLDYRRGAPKEWEPFLGTLNDIHLSYVRDTTAVPLIAGALEGILEGLAAEIEDASEQARIRGLAEPLQEDVVRYYASQPLQPNAPRDYNAMMHFLRVIRRDAGRSFSSRNAPALAVEGMVRSLHDPHSVYLDPERNKAFQESISGNPDSFGGIGIRVNKKSADLIVVAPIRDTPAWRAGIRAGDVISAVDDTPTADLTIEECVNLMKGEIGASVRITITRDEVPEPLHFTLDRARIVVQNVTREMLTDEIGIVDIRQFEKGVTTDTRDAVKFLVESGARAVILDLRYNPGGLLDEAASLSDLFLDSEKVIVSTRERRRNEERVFMARDNSDFETDPDLIVLMNRYSASASEIVAGALKAHRRARVLGETSFGKGSVQQIFRQVDGSGVKLTIARYFTPDDICIDTIGIVPDIVVKDEAPRVDDPEVAAAAAASVKAEMKQKYGDRLAVRLAIDPALRKAVDTLIEEQALALRDGN